jgi:hypothetical protein
LNWLSWLSFHTHINIVWPIRLLSFKSQAHAHSQDGYHENSKSKFAGASEGEVPMSADPIQSGASSSKSIHVLRNNSITSINISLYRTQHRKPSKQHPEAIRSRTNCKILTDKESILGNPSCCAW